MKSTSSKSAIETIERLVTVEGIRPIMFARYPGDNDTKLQWHEKIYLKSGHMVLPVENIISFYTAENTTSAPKRLRDARKYKKLCNALQSYLVIEAEDGSEEIPLMRDGKLIEVGNPNDAGDKKSGLVPKFSVPRLKLGIPNPSWRPLLPLPWSLTWKMTLIRNKEIKESEVRNLTEEGGLAIGFGTWRGRYGKFIVTRWE